MRLNETIALRNIEAGGPGSGRHSEGGFHEKLASPWHSELHDVLTYHGFKHAANGLNVGGDYSRYVHPKTGAVVDTRKNGNWTHESARGRETSGNGEINLDEHLAGGRGY
jgi:hypothetical protein